MKNICDLPLWVFIDNDDDDDDESPQKPTPQ